MSRAGDTQAGEYATDGRGRDPSDAQVLTAAAGGALLGDLALVVALAVIGPNAGRRLRFLVEDPVPVVPFAVWAFLGCAAVGAIAGVSYVRDGSLAPAGLAVLVYAAAVGYTWWSVPTRLGFDGWGEPVSQPVAHATSLEYLLLAWPVVFVGVVLVGWLERTLRQGTDRSAESAPE